VNDVEMKSCDDCVSGVRKYCDGFVFTDWSGSYTGIVEDLPKVPDPSKFWTFVECKKNVKKIQHLNLDGQCVGFQAKKK
jgi:hypothetical protein